MTKPFFTAPDPSKSVNQTECEMQAFWQKYDTFQRSIDTRHKSNEFVFLDGPPFATGSPHYGHILAGTTKDAVPRYWTMKGYRVNRKFGWDCHGLPVEFLIEKENGIGGKPGIEEMGVGKFNELCRDAVMRCADEWEEVVPRMGRFVDFKNDYKTMDPEFMESVWWVFKTLWDKGLIYEGHKVVPYSPKLGSPLSNFEANLNYKDIDDPAVTAKFEVLTEISDKPVAGKKTYILAWTTTPWTLPSNIGLGFGKNHQYVLVEHEGAYYWVAEDAASRYFPEDFEIIDRKLGHEFLGVNYRPLFDFFADETLPEGQKRYIAIHDKGDYVSTEAGTGIVHFSPFYGAEDAEICDEFGLIGINTTDENGYFTSKTPPLEGKYFRADDEVEGSKEDNANIWVLSELKERDLLFKREQVRHQYPFCWRTDCALMYRGITTWFVKVSAIKDRMIELNQQINWTPSHLKNGRFGKILEGAPDWAISRNRYWGTPLPIWRCQNKECSYIEVMGSRADLKEKSGNEVTDLHKHFVDDMTWECPKCALTSPCQGGTEGGLFLVRHGEAKADSRGEKRLTQKGQKNVQAEAQKHTGFDIIVHSPIPRAVETAEFFVKTSPQAEVIVDDKLREMSEENFEQVVKRVQSCLEGLKSKYKNKKILIVTHGTPAEIALDTRDGKALQKWPEHVTAAKVFSLSPQMKRIEEVLDCWFESGSMPYASVHYPFSGQEFKAANFISENMDQTRGWFYTLHVLGTALLDKPIFQNVTCGGIVLAEDGQKMSKSKKNYPDPNLIFEKYGADAMRFYLLQSPVATKGENLKFSEAEVQEVLKNLMLPLKNAYQFLSLYANIDGWKPTKFSLVRHGEAEHNVKCIYSSKINNPHHLTEVGKAEAAQAGQELSTFDHIYASPLVRTQETAQILAEEQNFKGEIKTDKRLREVDFGELDGLAYVPVKERLDHSTTENLSSIQARMNEIFSELAANHPGEHVAIVSHGGSIRSLQTGYYGLTQTEDHLKYPSVCTGQALTFFRLPESNNELDQWILSELQTLIKAYTTAFDQYDTETVCRLLPPFVDKLNNWYLRRNRKRFWAEGLDKDKQAGYATLHYVLFTVSKLLAPICPFFAEWLYQHISGEPKRSVHLDFVPYPIETATQPELEARVEVAREIVGLAASIRSRAGVKLRQPLNKLQFALNKEIEVDLDLIAAEANVKTVERLASVEGVATAIIKVDARQVGKKYGKKVQELIRAGKAGYFTLNPDGTVSICDEILKVGEYETAFLTQEGSEADSTSSTVVILDTALTPDLEREGEARELIRAIQDLRKSSGFEVSDHITITYQTKDEPLKTALQNHAKLIAGEVLAHSIEPGDGEHQINIDEKIIKLKLKKA